MSINHLVYPLYDGYIHNWLVSGPHATPAPGSDGVSGVEADGVDQIHRPVVRQQPALSVPPIDQGTSEIDGEKCTWNYYKCLEDHFVDVSEYLPNRQQLHTWAYTEIKSKASLPITLILTTSGPAEIWLNGKPIHRQENFSQKPTGSQVSTLLEQENVLLVRFEQMPVRECENVMALQVAGFSSKEAAESISVCIPTSARYPLRQQSLEQIFESAYLEEVVNHWGAHFNLGWADDLKQEITYAFKIMDARNSVYLEGNWKAEPGKAIDVGHTFRLNERPYFVTLTAPLKELFEHNLRYQRQLPIHVLDCAYSSAPYQDLAHRRLEALESATKYDTNLFSEIAKIELNRWSDLNPKLILESVDQVNRRDANSHLLLVGLAVLLTRYQANASFPENLKQPIAACLLNFKDWQIEPGESTSESQAILLHTSEILAGQLFPDHIFAGSSKTGLFHQMEGEQLALNWIRQRCGAGFADWNSNSTVEQVILALSTLTSLAKNDAIIELAAVLLDKILFLLAVNSFKGALGSSHGRTHVSMIKSAQLEATSGVSRLLWGMGVFNHHILGTVGLSSSTYEYPAFFADIATNIPEEMWGKERHATPQQGKETADTGEGGVNTVTYKTPDTMLSSAQDYRPGENGSHQHIWQATMGPDAVVFANHPACMSENEAHQPGFWLGNAVLPRAAQWKDVLIAIHNFSEQDWMGFTHAYFPTFAFDEHAFMKGWAFARKEKGYLALTAANGIELIKHGPDGYRELRSYGHKNVWICQMGRAAKDGSFTDFQNKVLKMKVTFQDLSVKMKSLRGENLSFGWQGPLVVNRIEQPITGFKHIENPYCQADLQASHLDINQGDFLLRLNLT